MVKYLKTRVPVCVITGLIISLIHTHVHSQTATELLQKAIQYHDQENYWKQFKGTLLIRSKDPNGMEKHRQVYLNKPDSKFEMTEQNGENKIHRIIENSTCSVTFNGNQSFSEEDKKRYRLTCAGNELYRNYFLYLYGLPMKLHDPGAKLAEKAEQIRFHNTDYWRLKVTYDQSVGTDTWYFYLDLETYALKAYQFYHDEGKGDGEYIMLSDLLTYNGMKIPKVRKWYTNQDDRFLGTDELIEIQSD